MYYRGQLAREVSSGKDTMSHRSYEQETGCAPVRLGRWPDFVVIGAARSGTTSLCAYLNQHPRVFISDPKEPFFFSHQSIYRQGESSYLRLFANASADQICGEASTSYSVWPKFGDVAGRIAAAVPEVKLIFIMRHPVDRSYSHYQHYVIRTQRDETFEKALDSFPPIVSASMYMKQIEQYLKYFPREAFHFLLLEDLKKNHHQAMSGLWEFLDVPSLAVDQLPCLNSGSEVLIRRKTIERLRARPVMSYLVDRVPRAWRRDAFRLFIQSFMSRQIAARNTRPQMRPEIRERLLKTFEGPNRELEQFLDRDLSRWFE
jgi:hypothetical protein